MLMSFISYVPTGCTPAQTSGSHDSDRPSSIAYARSAFHPGYLRYYFLLFALWTCRDYQSKSSKFEVLSLFSYVLPVNRKRRKGTPPPPINMIKTDGEKKAYKKHGAFNIKVRLDNNFKWHPCQRMCTLVTMKDCIIFE